MDQMGERDDNVRKEPVISETATEVDEAREALQAKARELADEIRQKNLIAQEAMKEGRGRLTLEKPIHAGDRDIDELVYDFTELTGMEYADAMDSDPNAQQIFRITNRQALALFATAAGKETECVDRQDILSKISITDGIKGAQLATLFFSASTRAGQMRISKK